MRKIILPLFLVFAYTGVFAQKQVIRITVVNEQKNALPGATVYLLNTDSVVIRSGAASASGIFEFTGFDAGKYLVRVSQAGYKDGYSPLISPDNKNLFSYTVILTAKSNLLNDVTVVSKKPAIQFLPDKTVINPEAGISNAGATVMDVLEKSPGITVAKMVPLS
ncbi:MAG: carboxypeptidase regulatory-like domain-containing protein [Chitinophagaceae bacterium]|nr:carboxypeptidase regulatory-like domain-containing protein [Chitinophagaceae bacterium]